VTRVSRVAWFLEHGSYPKNECCHRCDNPSCVRADHLFDGTHAENLNDAAIKGRMPRGRRHHGNKLQEQSVLAIRESSLSLRKLAVSFGVSATTIRDIKTRRTWTWI
jgi:hypothetical protein